MITAGKIRFKVRFKLLKHDLSEESQNFILGVDNTDPNGNMLPNDFEAWIDGINKKGEGTVIRSTISIEPLDKDKPKE